CGPEGARCRCRCRGRTCLVLLLDVLAAAAGSGDACSSIAQIPRSVPNLGPHGREAMVAWPATLRATGHGERCRSDARPDSLRSRIRSRGTSPIEGIDILAPSAYDASASGTWSRGGGETQGTGEDTTRCIFLCSRTPYPPTTPTWSQGAGTVAPVPRGVRCPTSPVCVD